MALNAFLKIRGKQQGEIKGSVTQRGREGTILVTAANHELLVPTSNAGVAAIGKRVHKPFTITKELDKSTPLLYKALVTGEDLITWELKFYTLTGTGIEIQNYTVKLTDAFISDIRFVLPDTRNADTAKLNPCEEIEFTYRQIAWVWEDGNISASDQWQPA